MKTNDNGQTHEDEAATFGQLPPPLFPAIITVLNICRVIFNKPRQFDNLLTADVVNVLKISLSLGKI